MKKLITFLFYLIINFCAYGQTELTNNFAVVLKKLNIKREDCYQDLVVEKILPYSKDKSVLVIPKIVEHDEGFFILDSYIVIVDNGSGKILNLFHEDKAWTSDAVSLETIVIDFAPYKLNSTTRAFGIRTRYSGSSRPNPYSVEYISLFYPENNKLIRVLKDFTIYSYTGEWDTNCNGEFYSENKFLIISDEKTNNFNNIISKVTYTTITRTFENDDCKDEEKVEKKTGVLKFKEGEYK